MNEVLEGLPATFMYDINQSLSKDITEWELSAAVLSMAKRKALGHDGVPIEFFSETMVNNWP